MALMSCPDCGGKLSDAAPTCVHCGRPNQESQQTPPPRNATPEPPEAGGSVLSVIFSVIGWLMVIGGAIWLVAAFNMDTSVSASGFGRVHNVGLMNNQQNHVIVAGILLLLGGVLIGVGQVRSGKARTLYACQSCGNEYKVSLRASWLNTVVCRDCFTKPKPVTTVEAAAPAPGPSLSGT